MQNHSNDKDSLLSRREFARKAALAAAAVAVVPASASPAASRFDEHASQISQAPSQTPLSPEDQAEVAARIAAILTKHGDQLSPEQKTDIRRLGTELQKPIVRLRAYPLENSSQPATVLIPVFGGISASHKPRG
jgi:hypothetical protein